MTPAQLSRTVRHAVCRAVEDGVLRVAVPDDVRMERPRPGGCGDWATGVALRLAGDAGEPARVVAERLRERIADRPGVAAVEITGPGFLNITLSGDPAGRQREIVAGAEGAVRSIADARRSYPPLPGSRAVVWDEVVGLLRRIDGSDSDTADGHVRRPKVVDHPDTTAVLGADATRWAFLSVAARDAPRAGAGLLRQHETNPLFTVRYAHARARALSRNAAALGFGADRAEYAETDVERWIADFPGALGAAARLRAPDRVARHLEGTADALLGLQPAVLPVGEEKPLAAHRSRLALAEAAGAVLAGGLSLLGISAPDHW
ncbi:ArgS-related anticodon-binding protein NrtL [Streptomyces sp. NPDC006798]|uniref:ArgS-related anticodon-binding protein NrtL n=1 Tax=Streptomyces sp. NPDC006798 TaxID=3155462 RepID=UPI0034111EC4